MSELLVGSVFLLLMAAMPALAGIALFRSSHRITRQHGYFVRLATLAGLSPDATIPDGLPDAPGPAYGHPTAFTAIRDGVRVGARRVNGPLDDQGESVQVWAAIPDLGFTLATSSVTASGGPSVELGDSRFTRALYLDRSGLAARAALDEGTRDALVRLLAAGRVSVGPGNAVAVSRTAEPTYASGLDTWLDEVVAFAHRLTRAAEVPIHERLARIAVDDAFPRVRIDAAEALAGLTPHPEVLDALAGLRGASDAQVAVIAELAAGDADAVVARVAESPEVGQRVADALEAASHGTGPPLLVARMRSPLGPFGALLLARLRSGGGRASHAAALLGRLGGFEEVPALVELAADVRSNGAAGALAADALDQIRARLRPMAGRLSVAEEAGGELALADELALAGEPSRRGRVGLAE